jgi:hypothetical protein
MWNEEFRSLWNFFPTISYLDPKSAVLESEYHKSQRFFEENKTTQQRQISLEEIKRRSEAPLCSGIEKVRLYS